MSDDIRLLKDLQAGDVYRTGTLDQAEQLVSDPEPAQDGGAFVEYRRHVGDPVTRMWVGSRVAAFLVSGPSKDQDEEWQRDEERAAILAECVDPEHLH